VVLIRMFLDGGCDSGLSVFLPAPKGVSYLVCTLGHRRVFILPCFAGRGWYVDLLCGDGWSIHHGLDLYLRGCYNPLVSLLIFILSVCVYLHFVDKLVRFMYPNFLCIFFFPFFNNIFMSILELGATIFLRHLLWPYKNKINIYYFEPIVVRFVLFFVLYQLFSFFLYTLRLLLFNGSVILLLSMLLYY